jgi:hypothetical protein
MVGKGQDSRVIIDQREAAGDAGIVPELTSISYPDEAEDEEGHRIPHPDASGTGG